MMKKRQFPAIKTISFFMAVAYLCLSIEFYYSEPFKGIAGEFLVGLYLVSCIGSWGAFFMKKWAPRMISLINLTVIIEGMILYLNGFPFPIAYLLVSFVSSVFYSQKEVRAIYDYFNKEKWESILIIDDDQTLVKTIRPMLVTQGYSVLVADSGETGLEMVHARKPDLVILDVILPGIKGREVCQEIKKNEQTKDIPVVFLTTKDSPDDIKAEMDVGAEMHLTKPVKKKVLLKTVRSILIKK